MVILNRIAAQQLVFFSKVRARDVLPHSADLVYKAVRLLHFCSQLLVLLMQLALPLDKLILKPTDHALLLHVACL